MARYVAFLRGINVGGHRVKMVELGRLFEAMKFKGVATFIASGNVVFESTVADTARLEKTIERHLEKALGYEAATFIRTLDELEAIGAFEPFPQARAATAGESVLILFLKEPLPRSTQPRLDAVRTSRDEFRLRGREIFWLSRGKITETEVDWKEFAAATGSVPSTMRNTTTVRRMVAKFGGAR